MMRLLIWLWGAIGLYVIPSATGAFIALDWTYLDFTTWSNNARVVYIVFLILWSAVMLFDGTGE